MGRPEVSTRSRPARLAVQGQGRGLAVAALLLSGWQICEALVPVTVGLVIDRAIATGDGSAMVRWLLATVVLFATLSFGYRFGSRRGVLVQENGGLTLRMAVTRHLLAPGASAGRQSGEVLSIATSDVNRVGGAGRLLGWTLVCGSGLVVAAVFLLSTSLTLGLIVLVGLPPVLFGLTLLTGPLQRRSRVEQERDAAATALAADLLHGVRVVQGLGAGPTAAARYREASRAAMRARIRSAWLLAGQGGLTVVISNVFLAGVALVGGRLAIEGRISVGEFVASVGLTAYMIGPIGWFADIATGFAQVRASAVRVADLLDTPPGVRSGPIGEAPPVALDLHVEDLSLGALPPLTFHVAAGEYVGIAVEDPSAAAALLSVLAREVDPAGGRVAIGGIDLRELALEVARGNLLVAAHDADLFEDTAEANVLATAADERSYFAAIEAAAAHDVLTAVAPGTRLSEWGRSLSGGQRQRLVLARALAADAPILILHDPTTAVDMVTEARISGGVRRMRRERCTLVVTTSPALLSVTDRVIHLAADSRPTEGTHDALLESSPEYRRLVLA